MVVTTLVRRRRVRRCGVSLLLIREALPQDRHGGLPTVRPSLPCPYELASRRPEVLARTEKGIGVVTG